jgi:nucleoside-diphosphate-sugar epimerase
MKLLVLGGTVFLSHAVAVEALERGHEVTCAARGTSGKVPDGATHLVLDRESPDWSVLADQEWDAVLDVARRPSWVTDALDALVDRVSHWTFVSTISVYADHSITHGTPETLPLLDPLDDDAEQDTPEKYGAHKVACERAVTARAPASLVIPAAGSPTGPSDSPRAATCSPPSHRTATPRPSTSATSRPGW